MKKVAIIISGILSLVIIYSVLVINPIYYLFPQMGIKNVVKRDYEKVLEKRYYEFDITQVEIKTMTSENDGEWFVSVSIVYLLPTQKGRDPNRKNFKYASLIYHVNKSDFNINYRK